MNFLPLLLVLALEVYGGPRVIQAEGIAGPPQPATRGSGFVYEVLLSFDQAGFGV